jgi:hypothetical protein
MVLDHEYSVYWAKLPELLEKGAGRYVVIHGDDVIGIFDTKDGALNAGEERWLFEPFLVTKIEAEKKPIHLNFRGYY